MMKMVRLSNDPSPLDADLWLAPYRAKLEARRRRADALERRLTGGRMTLADFAAGHEFFGVHLQNGEWVFREWAPAAKALTVVGDFTGWRRLAGMRMKPLPGGVWELRVPRAEIRHGMLYKLLADFPGGGSGERIPAYARCVVQDPVSGKIGFIAVKYTGEV